MAEEVSWEVSWEGGGTKSRDEIVFIRRSRSATKLQEVR